MTQFLIHRWSPGFSRLTAFRLPLFPHTVRKFRNTAWHIQAPGGQIFQDFFARRATHLGLGTCGLKAVKFRSKMPPRRGHRSKPRVARFVRTLDMRCKLMVEPQWGYRNEWSAWRTHWVTPWGFMMMGGFVTQGALADSRPWAFDRLPLRGAEDGKLGTQGLEGPGHSPAPTEK
jgi:hypothetical protein